MKRLNQLKYRIAFSLLIAFIFTLAAGLRLERFDFSIFLMLVVTVIVFIPLTLIWAIISTFFMDEKKNSSDDVIDN